MEFSRLIVLISFVVAVGFSFADITTDMALAYNYYKKGVCAEILRPISTNATQENPLVSWPMWASWETINETLFDPYCEGMMPDFREDDSYFNESINVDDHYLGLVNQTFKSSVWDWTSRFLYYHCVISSSKSYNFTEISCREKLPVDGVGELVAIMEVYGQHISVDKIETFDEYRRSPSGSSKALKTFNVSSLYDRYDYEHTYRIHTTSGEIGIADLHTKFRSLLVDINFGSDFHIFFYLTTIWIILGGALQSIIVLRLLYQSGGLNSVLDPFPTPLRYLLLILSIFLMGPVFTGLFGVYLIVRNRDVEDIDK